MANEYRKTRALSVIRAMLTTGLPCLFVVESEKGINGDYPSQKFSAKFSAIMSQITSPEVPTPPC
jgi:hypothetical protein